MLADGTNGESLTSTDGLPSQPLLDPEPSVSTGDRLGTFRALRHRNYRLYFTGQIISMTGSWLQTTALMWLAFHLTQESKWPALIMALQIFPTCLLGFWSGSLAQRLPRRGLILCTQAALMVNALVLAGLVLSGAIMPWHLLAIAGFSGLINAIDLPARLSFLFDMVGREDLLNAVALNSLTFNLARALGPALSGVLLDVLGPGLCFLINGLTFTAVLIALMRMQTVTQSRPPPSNLAASERGAFRYLAGRPALALLLVLVGVMCFFGWPTLSLLPALAKHELNVEQRGYGLLLSSVGCGALLAALTVATYGSLDRSRRFIAVGVLVIVGGLVGLSLVKSMPLAIGCCVLVGYGLIIFMATSQAVVQLSAGDHNRGPIMGIWSMVLSGSQPLGNALIGPMADYLGEPPVLRLQALGCAVGAMVVLGLLLFFQRRRGLI